jgi:amidase
MNRREFLQVGALGAALTGRQISHDGVGPGPARATPVPSFDHEEQTIASLQSRMTSGELTAKRLTEAYLERIDDIDRRGPALRSVIELNPDARAIAEVLDRERKEKGARGPLHGIPILIKDNIDTADRMKTSAGSLALAGSVAARDAFLVERLRQAGAVILGKTNLSEWANFRSSQSTSGWSARGGQTKNPYVLDRNPCGSSSGSGAAVSANLCTAAIGTETDGSIVCPSNACGLVGIKPTLGLVSRSGIIPIAESQDTAGPMTRTVADAAALLWAMAGVDPRDSATGAAARHATTDYTTLLDKGALRGARIGVARRFAGFLDQVDRLIDRSVAAMKDAGAIIIDPANLPTHGKFDEGEFEVLLYEFKDGLNKYLAGLGPSAPVKSLADLIAFNEKHAAEELPYFGQDIFIKAQKKGRLSDRAYRTALRNNRRLTRIEGIDAVMKRHRLDAIVAPTGGPAWLTDLINGDHFGGGSSSAPAIAGYPNITVPMGFVFDLPVGLSFFGRAWSEPTVIRLAYAFEQATQARRAPAFHPTSPAREDNERRS